MKQNKKVLMGAVALLVAVLVFAGAWFAFGPKATAGSKKISVTVVHADETSNVFELSTDQEFLRGALEEAELVQGTESEYGLYVLTVDGETADEGAQQWWCFTKGGEAVMTGIDSTPIADGEAYEVTLTTGW